MYYPNFYAANENKCIALYDDAPGQTILDLLSRKPFMVNIHSADGKVLYGQIIEVGTRRQRIRVQLANNAGESLLSLSGIHYITLPLPIRPPQFSSHGRELTSYMIRLADNTPLHGFAQAVFQDRDGLHIWQRGDNHDIKHLFIPGTATAQAIFYPVA